MRILYSVVPAPGHFLPLLPLARAGQDRGDTIAMLSAEGIRPLLADDGIELLPAGVGMDVLATEAERRLGPMELGTPDPKTMTTLFVDIRAEFTADEALAAAKAWQPDVIVSDMTDVIGPLVASALGIRWAYASLGTAIPPMFETALTEAVAPLYAARGLEPTPYSWFLDLCPPTLQPEWWTAPQQHVGLRPEPHRLRGYVAPDDVARPRPRVLVSFGTHFGKPDVLKPVVAGLAELDVDIVVPLSSGGAPSDFGNLTERAEFGPFKPLAELLPGTDLLISHAGNGTVFGTLAKGIPVVSLPQGADQFILADRLAATGVGRTLLPNEVTPQAVAEVASHALSDSSMRAVAKQFAEEIAGMPSAEDVAAELN